MEKEKYEAIDTIELFGREYDIESNKNGYIKLKGTEMFIRGGVVYSQKGNTPLSLAQTDKIRRKMVRIVENDPRTPEQKTNEEIIELFKEG